MEYRKIPRVAFASLSAIGAVSCGDSEDHQTTLVNQILRDTCESLECAFPAQFNATFDSLSECVNAYKAELQSYIATFEQNYGAACADAYLELYACYSRAASNYICDSTPIPANACADEYAALLNDCPL